MQRLATQSDLHIARHQLLEQLSCFVVFRGYRGMVVFDAHQQTFSPAPQLAPVGLEVAISPIPDSNVPKPSRHRSRRSPTQND
ncbi:NYN domain-containing protein [Synechococcus sp. PCC 7336]|uniref:NYN domain-containing protein n=1 Tax=Synechococcus sp. PCC 7336 TaxID=195250 RepID=UPI00034CAFC6|nr:NYN domain-containing protein [Synechococcus sp. PCC 7336]